MSIIFNTLPLPPPVSEFGEPFYRSIKQAIEAINMYAQPLGFGISRSLKVAITMIDNPDIPSLSSK
ncbi:uncharacterized protein N7529_007369 [Penicillium soppii]|uniref:uncharacterized protein n=1 Tax=Penicillium soppii TaxID=69789 RepID=UPI002546F55B|nr:uncharacterized protein N7529_007369 [Penicillium soppii]KAJ5860059.1 hypothetical protein N7529_007369 [Penicillium soppii]